MRSALKPRTFSFNTAKGETGSAVHFFFALGTNSKSYSIEKKIDVFEDRCPKGLLAIACDPFGNLILLDIGAKKVGNIYFWDHELESEDDPTWENISFVATSFEEFEHSLS
jgi:hypothetical protein